MHPYELHRFILSEIPLLDNKIVLDLGCGRGIWGYLMRSERMGDNAYLIGIDLYKPYLQFCKKYQVYDNILIADVRFLPFKDKSVDVVLAIEIIEHLEKDEGYKFIDNIERICKEKIIISTPNGWREQNAINEPQSQRHKSSWTVKYFKKRGYKIRGFGLKIHPKNLMLWGGVRYFFTPISFVFPRISEGLICTKVYKGEVNDKK